MHYAQILEGCFHIKLESFSVQTNEHDFDVSSMKFAQVRYGNLSSSCLTH